jgi:hypothetical protein
LTFPLFSRNGGSRDGVPRREAPRPVMLVSRWHQALSAVVVVLATGSLETGLRSGTAGPFVLAAFLLVVAAVLFVAARALVAARAWAWWTALALSAAMLLLAIAALLVAPQRPDLRAAAIAVTVLLFGPGVVLLLAPPVRRFVGM